LNELDDLISTHEYSRIEDRPGAGFSEKINPLHTLSLQELTGPILYKLRGSQDVPDSCAISTDQYFEFTRRALSQNFIPAQISEIIANSPMLLLGYGFLDPDFRLTYHVLLQKPSELPMDLRYAVQLPPEREMDDLYRQMELSIWDNVKTAAFRMGIATIEEQGEIFLERLLDRVRTTLPGAL